jgi:archaeosine synthase
VGAAFATEPPAVDFPSAAAISPETAGDLGTDAYVLAGGPSLVGHAAAFVGAVVETRRAVPDDTALVLSGAATPANVAALVWAGVDLLDEARAVVRGSEGWYLTTHGSYRLQELTELPCACPTCADCDAAAMDREACVDHNRNALAAALRTVRERIRVGRLRDYLEGQARHEAWPTGVMRRLDDEGDYVEERTPLYRTGELSAATEDTLHRAEIRRFGERVVDRYRNRFEGPLVLVPCSARKPYSDSQSHEQFRRAIRYRAHLASMTSPIGVVPQELELIYPAQHYDAVVTGRWSPGEVEFVAGVLADYLAANPYDRVIAHVPPGGYRDIVERALERLDEEGASVDVAYTAADHLTTDESLAALDDALSGEDQYGKRERQHNTLKAIADYQFGDGAGDALFEDIRVKGRYPKLKAYARGSESEGEQLAALVPNYGVLSFTLAGARLWRDSDAPTKVGEIDDFVPHGSVLAPGVVDASDDIRVGDEVVIEGPQAFAVGRAEMSGPEMVGSSRGIASSVRHVEEL